MSIILKGLGTSTGGGGQAVDAAAGIANTFASDGDSSLQAHPTAQYILVDGDSHIKRADNPPVVKRLTFDVIGGSRVNTYDQFNYLIESYFLPTSMTPPS